ncbi:MAG: hypothetical protein PUA90_00645 [bacterium]|nr:hypothetical protein [bacterium]
MGKNVENTKKTKPKISNNKVKSKKKTTKKRKVNNRQPISKSRFIAALISLTFLGILLIFSTYAWFSSTLNVRIKTFNMLVSKNAGLEISFDAVNYAEEIEISENVLFEDVPVNYPNHKSFWSTGGLFPVSTIGNKSNNSYFFDIYRSPGVKYHNLLLREDGYVQTVFYPQTQPKKSSGFLAFDIFFRNDNNGSPTADNLYFDIGTGVKAVEELSEQMEGLFNSIRIGIVKVGSVPMDATAKEAQSIQCNNNCKSIIYEPNSTSHTQMSIDKANKFNLTVIDGEYYPTYANIQGVNQAEIIDTLSGSPTLDTKSFALQKTITEKDFDKPLFTIPHGITKARIYVWIEGGDIDSIETDSEGAEINLSINFVKDTNGWDNYE